MIRDANEARIVSRNAREWRDKLRTQPGRGYILTTTERLELAKLLDELQHATTSAHGLHGGRP